MTIPPLTGLRSAGFTAANTVPAASGRAGVTCVVRLIDRRTGRTPQRNGRALQVFTATPEVAVAALLRGRDRTLWEARVDPLGPGEVEMPLRPVRPGSD